MTFGTRANKVKNSWQPKSEVVPLAAGYAGAAPSGLDLSEELFDNMQYSDVNFNIDGRELNRSPVCHFLPIKSLKFLLKYDN